MYKLQLFGVYYGELSPRHIIHAEPVLLFGFAEKGGMNMSAFGAADMKSSASSLGNLISDSKKKGIILQGQGNSIKYIYACRLVWRR